MKRYFFHLASAHQVSRDGFGTEFPSIEEAYLGGCKAALEMGIELLRDRSDPSIYRFEVCDDAGKLLWEIPFSEVLQPTRQIRPESNLVVSLNQKLARSRALRAQLTAALAQTRSSMEVTRQSLARLREPST